MSPLSVEAPALPKLTIPHRGVIFSIALVVRVLAGVLFLGSVDLINSATNSMELLNGHKVYLPYFPVVNAFLWFGGVVSAVSPIPLPLSLKLGPILFDALLALLIYELVRRTEPKLAFRAGLLYALNPLALLITSFHGQWDAIALFFLLLAFGILLSKAAWRSRFFFGGVFCLGVLVKPIGLPFLLLFPARKRARWFVDWPAVTGLCATFCAAWLFFRHYGYFAVDSILRIFFYTADGIQTFGLPMLLPHLWIWQYRLPLILPSIVILADLYRRRKLAALDAILLFFLYCLGTTGLSPQYLLWPLPFLIATKRLRIAALYTGVTTAFLLLSYPSPTTTYYPSENLGVLAPLRVLGWLAPPAALAKPELLPLLHALGNVAIPACAWIVFACVVRTRDSQLGDEARGIPLRNTGWYAASAALAAIVILAAKISIHASQLDSRLKIAWNALPVHYAVHLQAVEPSMAVSLDVVNFVWWNVATILGVATGIWCACAVIGGRAGSPLHADFSGNGHRQR